ncbi:MAG: hypothetical protein VZS44_06990 [Bacilli bacterium]|nr:hypothetical protein [Bacilli bacterium]
MLKIDTEFRKGIFFIRLSGKLDNYLKLKSIYDLTLNLGIRYVVLNTSNLLLLDVSMINYIYKYNDRLIKNNGYLLICDTNNHRKRIFNAINNINCEIDAFALI